MEDNQNIENINVINIENKNENQQEKIEDINKINDDDKNDDNFNLIDLSEDKEENNNKIIKLEIKEQNNEEKQNININEETLKEIKQKNENLDNLLNEQKKVAEENNIKNEININEEKIEIKNEINNNENEFNIISNEIEEEENNKIIEIKVFKNNDKIEKEKQENEKSNEQNNQINIIENNTIHEIKNEINENEAKNLDAKNMEKIFKYSEANYHEFISDKHFCDYNTGEGWNSGYIISIKNDIATVIDAINPEKNEKEINIKDRRNISYIRKYSLPNNFMTKGSSKNLKNKLTQFINFHKDFDNYVENCSNFDFYYFLRVTVYYGLDFCMSSSIKPENVFTSFQLILAIIDIIIDCLKFIRNNFKEFIEYETTIKNTELADLVLLDKKFAIFSFFDDIHFLLKKIFADSPQYLNWYIKYKKELMDFNPALNINKINMLNPELDNLPNYSNGKLKKICINEIYDNLHHTFYTLDKEINTGLVAYFVDYFNHFDGFKILFKLSYSMNLIDMNNYKVIFDILNNIIDDLFLVKTITNAFDKSCENEKQKLDNFVNDYLNKLEENILEKIGKKEIFGLISKIFDLIEKDEIKNKVLKEKAIINFSFNKFISEKKLEKRIFYLTEINNIISSTEYNGLYKKIYLSKKENTNTELKEDILKDIKFKDRNKGINETTSHQFCKVCHEKNIIHLILSNNSHEEIIKRLYPVLKIMYLNDFGLKESEKEEIKKEKEELFNALFNRLKEVEKNDENIWKLLHDIIINFTECLTDKDKYEVFILIKNYFIESINATGYKQIKINNLFDLLINFSLKSIDEKKINLDKESNFDDLSEEKFYCLDVLLNIIIEKNKINELNINLTKEQKEEIINLCINGISEIFSKANYNEILIKTVIEKIMTSIFKLINITQDNLLLEKLISKNIVFKESIEEFCSKKTDEEIINLINELTSMTEITEDELYNFDIKLDKILDFIFILFQSPKFIRKGYEKMKIFELLLSPNEIIKNIFVGKLIKNLENIIYEIKIHIFNNILTIPNSSFIINDFQSYQLIKEFAMNLNTHSNKFTYITKSEFIVLFEKINDIFGYEKLFQILLDSDNNEIQNDIQDLISEIYLNVKFSSKEKYKHFWNSTITDIIDLLKKLVQQQNNKGIKGIIGLFKKIIQKSKDDGEVIKNKQIINGLIDKAKNSFLKENEAKKQNSIKVVFDYSYYNDKGNISEEKINTNKIKSKKNKKIQEKNISEMTNKKMTGEIYQNEFLYYLRYLLSYECELPLRCIEISLYTKDNNNFQKYTILDDYLTIYDTIKTNFDNLKKTEQYITIIVRKIKNPLSDEKNANLMHIIKSNKELLNILGDLLKQKNYNNLDILEIMKENENENDDFIKKGIFDDFNKLINEPNDNISLLNELFNFENANSFYKNFVLKNLYDFMTKKEFNQDKKILQLIKSNIWENKFKQLDIKKIVIKDSIDDIKYIFNLLNIYCFIAQEIKDDDNESNNIEILSNKMFDIFYLIVNESINKKIETNEIKNIYYDILDKINNIYKIKDKISLAFIKLILKDKENFSNIIKFCFVDGILKNKFPFLNNKIQEFILCLIQNKIFNENKEDINEIRNRFYLFISSLFFDKTNNVNIYALEIIIQLFKKTNDDNEEIYLYNIKSYYSIISEILFSSYKCTSKEINYSNYIIESVIPYIYEPLIKKSNKYSPKINDIYFGAQCQILYNYIDVINIEDLSEEQYYSIYNYKGKNIKKYLFDEIIMLNCDKNNYKTTTQLKKSLQIYHSSKQANHLFISLLIKDINNKNDDLINFLKKINSFNTLGYWYGDDISNWKLNYNTSSNEAVRVNNFIGLKNLGCTCYMNSLMQTFYNIVPLRESILRFKISQTKKNCLYELQKIFFNLKFCKERYYTPSTFVENYDNEKLNTHQQMDIDEFFSNLIDRLENRMKKTENENLIKYFFQGHINDVLTFQEGCSHHRTNTSNFYSIQLQIRNKKSLYESLDTLIEGELMNEDNCIICPQCNKKMPAIKSQNFKTLPRMLIFVLKRFEFDFTNMTRIKLNDYYEFPIDLDMNRFTGDFLNNKGKDVNNKYKLKSIVIHQGHCEGGHYYAFIRDNKTQEWHQFNDTNVTYFDIKDIPKEAYGGNTNKNAYLLFYEKDDTSNCEMFDKIQEIKNLEENKENQSDNEEKEEQDENNIINENEIVINKDKDEKEFNLIKEDNININEIKEINNKEKNEKINNNNSNNNKIVEENIYEEDIKNYLNKKLFSKDYHHLTLEMYINALYSFNKNMNKDFILTENDANLKKYNKIHPIEQQIDLPEKPKHFSQNLSRYIKSGKLKVFKTETNLTDEEIKEKNLLVFQCIILSYFNVIIHSEERKYLGCYVDLIKFLVIKYDYCANYLLEEFINYNVIMEYLKNCPLYEIKKVTVGIIDYAMNTSINAYKGNKNKNSNINMGNQEPNSLDENNNNNNIKSINDDEIPETFGFTEFDETEIAESKIAIKSKNKNANDEFEILDPEKELPKEEQYGIYTQHYQDSMSDNINSNIQINELNNEKNNSSLLKNKNIPENILKFIYNIIYVMKKIKFNNLLESRFLYSVLIKFCQISDYTFDYILKNLDLSLLLNCLMFQEHGTNDYSGIKNNLGDFNLNKSAHKILDPKPNEIIQGEYDKFKNIKLKYAFQFFMLLSYNLEPPRDKAFDPGFSFFNSGYVIDLITKTETRQELVFISNLFNKKCYYNKEFLKNIIDILKEIVELITDGEDAFYDKFDKDNNSEIYRNEKKLGYKLRRLKSNIHYIFVNLFFYSGDNLIEFRQKEIMNALFNMFKEYKKYYGLGLYCINIIIDIYLRFKEKDKKKLNRLNELKEWLEKYKIPPKLYEIKGIEMYKTERKNKVHNSMYLDLKNLTEVNKKLKDDFDNEEIAKTNKKIELINSILNSTAEKNMLEIDLTKYNFDIGEKVIYANKKYEVVQVVDEMIKIKEINNTDDKSGNNNKENKFKVKGYKEKLKKININEKEKENLWIENDNYKLKIIIIKSN